MSNKRFRTRRQWSNTMLWGWASTGLILACIALSGMTGNLLITKGALVVALGGFIISIAFDRPTGVSYAIEGDELVMKNRKLAERIPLAAINDASLVDRRAARDLLFDRLKAVLPAERSAMRRTFTRWCTVDIGMRSVTFGIGRDLIDKRPDSKQDLVILRLRDSRVLVLSPVYNQDMVESLTRAFPLSARAKRTT
jgi:hypothetical protein